MAAGKFRDLNLNLGGLFRGLFSGGGDKMIPCLKLVRIMLKT